MAPSPAPALPPRPPPSTFRVAAELRAFARRLERSPARVAEAERIDWLRNKAAAVEDCGQWAVARVHRTEDRASAIPARCRVRGCPRCDRLRAAEVSSRQRRAAIDLASSGLELRALTLTLPGNPDHTLAERLEPARAAITRLRRSAIWRSGGVVGASVYFECPRNAWHADKAARARGERDDVRRHWHVHAHVLLWIDPASGALWPESDREGRTAAGGWHPLAVAWSRAAGWSWSPAAPARRDRRPLRVQCQIPYVPSGLAVEAAASAAVEAAAVYATKYASKGTGDASRLTRSEDRLAWIWQARGARFLEHYGCAKSAWERAAPAESEWATIGSLAELEAAAEELPELAERLEAAEATIDRHARRKARAAALRPTSPDDARAIYAEAAAAERAQHRAQTLAEELARRLRRAEWMLLLLLALRRRPIPEEWQPLLSLAYADAREHAARLATWEQLRRSWSYARSGRGEWVDSLREGA